MHMKKRTAKRITKHKHVAARKAVHHKVVHGPGHNCPGCNMKYGGMWGKDRSMLLLLAAGTIILAVVGMYMAGWL